MVQLYYWDLRGQSASTYLKKEGFPHRIQLYPYEGWARSASQTYWVIKTSWWSSTKCKVIEVVGTRRRTGKAKVKNTGNGNVSIEGKLKIGDGELRYFRLYLTTQLSNSDFNMGYGMTGYVERSSRKGASPELTHFAMIKRKGY